MQSKYLNSALGAVWVVLHPLMQVVVYTLIFSTLMRARLPGVEDTLGYGIYLCAGLLGWQYFVEVAGRMQSMFIDQSSLLKKVSFPRTSLPVYILLSASVNYFILLTIFVLFLMITDRMPGAALAGVLPLLLIQQCFAAGLGILIGTLHVFFRDVGYAMTIVVQFWFWLTPIVYPIDVVPESLRWIMEWNPMADLAGGYQHIFLLGQWPEWGSMLSTSLIAALFLALGYFTFIKLDKDMVDEL